MILGYLQGWALFQINYFRIRLQMSEVVFVMDRKFLAIVIAVLLIGIVLGCWYCELRLTEIREENHRWGWRCGSGRAKVEETGGVLGDLNSSLNELSCLHARLCGNLKSYEDVSFYWHSTLGQIWWDSAVYF